MSSWQGERAGDCTGAVFPTATPPVVSNVPHSPARYPAGGYFLRDKAVRQRRSCWQTAGTFSFSLVDSDYVFVVRKKASSWQCRREYEQVRYKVLFRALKIKRFIHKVFSAANARKHRLWVCVYCSWGNLKGEWFILELGGERETP